MKKNLIIGLCVAVALVILFFGIEFLKGVNVFSSANSYHAVYTNVQGLQVSAPVEVNGFKVGQVSTISYEYDNPGHVRVDFSLDSHLKVPKGTQAVIRVAMLGTASVELVMGQSTEMLPSGSELLAAATPGMVDKLTSELLPGVSSIVPHVDTLITNVNNVVSDPAVMAAVQRLDAITQSLSATLSSVELSVKTVPAILNHINEISADLRTISSNLADFTGNIKELPVDSTMANILAITENVRRLSDSLNSADSSLGKLLNDDGLYDNLTGVAVSLDSLLRDIKKNPKRYISIKLL